MNKTVFPLLSALCLSISSSMAAVSINWQSTGALTTGESVIDTEGTLAYAYNLGDAATYTVNTVQFKGTASGAVADFAGEGNVLLAPPDNGSNANFSNLTGDFGSLINSAAWGFSDALTTITLGNLTDGQTYKVQIFSSDVRVTRNNTLVLDAGAGNEFSSSETGSVANGGGDGAYVIGTFVADGTGQATFTFRYLATSGNANINAIQVRDITPSTTGFVHPGIGLTVTDLDHIKARLTVEPWKTGYDDMAASPRSSLSYVMQGPYVTVSHKKPGNPQPNDPSDPAWENDMEAVHNLARMWYFTDNAAYAQKARDILITWANNHTLFDEGEVYLEMGYRAHQVFEGAEILRGTWPGWTQADTDTLKTYFETVWWNSPYDHLAVPDPLRSANQGMSQLAAALGVAVFLDDEVKFEQCLKAFRSDAAAALGNTLPNGQIGDNGRDAHDQGQLMLMAWCAEVFWNQGVDVYSEYDNRLLAAGEYLARFNLLVDTPFIQAGTVYDIYSEFHQFDGEYTNWGFESKMITLLHTAYVVRKGMRAPYLEQFLGYAPQNESSFCHLMETDGSTATAPATPAASPAAVSSVTSLNSAYMGDTNGGTASYNAGSKTWTVSGNGPRMWYSDPPDYHFAYLEVTGDATIIAKLTGLSGGSTNDARAGLVFSENLSDSADMQAIVVTNPSGTDPQTYSFRRGDVAHAHQGNDGSRSYLRQSSPKIPYWLKIERIGDRVNCYSSPDGISWSCGESADYDIGATAYFGLAVSSDQSTSQSTATFTDVRITGGDGGEAMETPEAPFAIYASPGCDEIPLRWLESFEADSYNLYRSTQAGGPFTTPYLTGLTGTSYIDTNVNFGTHYYYAISAVNTMGESPISPVEPLNFVDTSWYEAEDYDAQSGFGTESTQDYFGGLNLSNSHPGDWARYDNIPLPTGAIFRARIAAYNAEVGQLEVRLGGTTGTLIGTMPIIDTGGAQSWGSQDINLTGYTPGVHDLYLVWTPVSGETGVGFNLNWFDIIDPAVTAYDLGMDQSLTYDPAMHELKNFCMITAWDASSTYLQLQDGSDFSNFDFTQLGITSWTTTDFDNAAVVTTWDGANLSGITLHSDGNFGAGDSFTGADFTNVVWGTATSTADPAKFFSGGSGATSAATAADAIDFSGADLSLITGAARTTMINNLGGFDGDTPIGAKIDPGFIANSGWDQAALLAAGWQLDSSLLAHWTFDEGTGSTTTADITGNGHDGTISNTSWVSGYENHGLGFNGSSSQVTNIGSAFSSINDQITISLWAYGGSSQPVDNSIIYAVNSSGGRILSVHLPFGNGQIYWDAGDSGYDRINKAAAAADYKDSWAHWVFTKNANTGDMNIYRNGTLWHSGTGKTKTMTGITEATIGSQISGAYYSGNIDDVRLYDVELNPTEVANLYASYPPTPTYTLTYTAGSNGSINGTNPQTVSNGNDGTAISAVPETNYHFVNWSDTSTANPRTDLNVTGNITVTANFAIDTYTLSYNADANGSITGISQQTIDHGANGTAVSAVPGTNYHFVNWSDGSTANPRTDLNVTENLTVTANFAIDTYSLNYTAGANGSITGTSQQTIEHGADGTAVTAVAEANYHFVNWSDASTANPRTDLNVTNDITVTANFELSYTALENWRFTQFGTYDNTGNAADDADADSDGNLNIIEYATGTDPNVPSGSPIVIRPSGSGLEVAFNRIADTSLNYTIEGTNNLFSITWDSVWTGTGTSADEIIVPDTSWPSNTNYFLRLRVNY